MMVYSYILLLLSSSQAALRTVAIALPSTSVRYLIDALELSNNLRRSTTDGFDTGELSQQALVYSWRN